MSNEKKISYTGNYWWGQEHHVTDKLAKEFAEILREVQVSRIEISGNDFNDGRQFRKVKISVSSGEITIEKNYE